MNGVDVQRRLIPGVVMPADETAVKDGRRWRFPAGSIEWGNPIRVKLFRDHDRAQHLGWATELAYSAAGALAGWFRVRRGGAGDDVLALAAGGELTGLSAHLDYDPADAVRDPATPGLWLVQRAALTGVSLTTVPAFAGARLGVSA